MEHPCADGYIFSTDYSSRPQHLVPFYVVENIVADVLKKLLQQYKHATYIHASGALPEKKSTFVNMMFPFHPPGDAATVPSPREVLAQIWPLFKTIYNESMLYPRLQLQPLCAKCHPPTEKATAAQSSAILRKSPMIASYATLEKDPNVILLVWTDFPELLLCHFLVCVEYTAEYVIFQFRGNEKWKYLMKNNRTFKKMLKDDLIIGDFETIGGEMLAGMAYKPLWLNVSEPDGELPKIVGVEDTRDDMLLGYPTGIISVCPFLREHKYYVASLARYDFSSMTRATPVLSSEGFIVSDTYPVNYNGCSISEVAEKMIAEATAAGMLMVDMETLFKMKHIGRMDFCGQCNAEFDTYRFEYGWFLKSLKFKDEIFEYLKTCDWNTNGTMLNFLNETNHLHDWKASSSDSDIPIPIWVSSDMKEIVVVGTVQELLSLASAEDQKVITIDTPVSELVHLAIPSRQEIGTYLRHVGFTIDPPILDALLFNSLESKSNGSGPNLFIHFRSIIYKSIFPRLICAFALKRTLPHRLNIVCASMGHYHFSRQGDFYPLFQNSTTLPAKTIYCDTYRALFFHAFIIDSLDFLEFVHVHGSKQLAVNDVITKLIQLLKLLILNIQSMEGCENALREQMNPEYDLFEYTFDENFFASPLMTPLDTCILGKLREMNEEMKENVEKLKFDKLLKILGDFVELLSNKYCRLNKLELRNNLASIHTFFFVLSTFATISAPFFPLCAETIASQLDAFRTRRKLDKSLVPVMQFGSTKDLGNSVDLSLPELVHSQAAKSHDQCALKPFAIPNMDLFRASQALERGYFLLSLCNSGMNKLKELNYQKKTLEFKFTVFIRDKQFFEEMVAIVENLIRDLGFPLELKFSDFVQLLPMRLELDKKKLGPRLKKELRNVQNALAQLSAFQKMIFRKTGMEIAGHQITVDDLLPESSQLSNPKSMKPAIPAILKNIYFDSIAVHVIFALSYCEENVPFDIKFVILAKLLDAINANDEYEMLRIQQLSFSTDALVLIERTKV